MAELLINEDPVATKTMKQLSRQLSAKEYVELEFAIDEGLETYQPTQLFQFGAQPPIDITKISKEQEDDFFYNLSHYDYEMIFHSYGKNSTEYAPKFSPIRNQSQPSPTTFIGSQSSLPSSSKKSYLNSYEKYLDHS